LTRMYPVAPDLVIWSNLAATVAAPTVMSQLFGEIAEKCRMVCMPNRVAAGDALTYSKNRSRSYGSAFHRRD
jgi:hypothetical protein